jgi:hypothetical protein
MHKQVILKHLGHKSDETSGYFHTSEEKHDNDGINSLLIYGVKGDIVFKTKLDPIIDYKIIKHKVYVFYNDKTTTVAMDYKNDYFFF